MTSPLSGFSTVQGQPASTAGPVLDLTIRPLHGWPFPHVMVDDFVRPDVYQALVASFPACPPITGPTGFSCYWGSPQYDALIESNWAWKALFEATHSQAFVDYALAQFDEVFRRRRCTVPLEQARYVPYCESAADKERRHLARVEHAPNELWVRTDIHQGQLGYERRPHVDHRRRLISMLIYLCDQAENQMEGGELVLHPSGLKKLWPVSTTVAPRHNRMAAFACPADSVHSVPPIRRQSAPRNFIQVTVSSSVDAWPR